VYGPVCTVVWQGSAGDRRPYADQVRFPETFQNAPFRLKSGFACISRRRPAFYFSDSRADTPDENVPRNGKPYGSPCSEA